MLVNHFGRNSENKHIVEYDVSKCSTCKKIVGSSKKLTGAHHAEIFTGEWDDGDYSVFSCGSAPSDVSAYKKGKPDWHSCFTKTSINGNTRYTLFAILRLNASN